MVPVHVSNSLCGTDAANAHFTQHYAPVVENRKVITVIPIAKNRPITKDIERSFVRVGSFNPGFNREVLQPQTRRIAERHPVVCPIETECLADQPRPERRVAR